MVTEIVRLPGDGVGPEVMAQAVKVLDKLESMFGLEIRYKDFECGGKYYLRTGEEWSKETRLACEKADAVLLGAIGTAAMVPGEKLPKGDRVIFGLRQGLNLYANIRPIKLYPGVSHMVSKTFKPIWEPSDVDLVIVRENTEGLYINSGGELVREGRRELAIDTRLITRVGSQRICKYAFETALARKDAMGKGNCMVTCVDKKNVLQGCRLFYHVFEEVAKEYPDVETEHAHIDAFAHNLVRDPGSYDVVVTTNLFGDIISDLGAALLGGLGMASSANIGDSHAVFEPVHGSAPDIEGKDIANPFGMILSARMMLDWLAIKKGDERFAKASKALEDAHFQMARP